MGISREQNNISRERNIILRERNSKSISRERNNIIYIYIYISHDPPGAPYLAKTTHPLSFIAIKVLLV